MCTCMGTCTCPRMPVHVSSNAFIDEFTEFHDEERLQHDELSVESSPTELLFHINHLRGRLERRNAILDAVRKAYHRDVITIKEHLYRAKSNTGQDPLPSTIPSIDLRPALKLYAPEECELRLKPCYSCGGQLEIVHRDSARIQRLQNACHDFQSKEQELRLKLVETERRAHIDRQECEKVKARANEDREIFIDKVNKLKRWIVGYDHSRKECSELRETVARLESQNEGYRKSLTILEETQTKLSEANVDLEEHRLMATEKAGIIEELTKAESRCRYSEATLKSDCHALSSSVWLLNGELADKTSQCQSLSRELVGCKEQHNETKDQLDKALRRIAHLEALVTRTKDEYQCTRSELMMKQENMEQTILRQERDIQSKEEELNCFRDRINDSTHALQRIRLREGSADDKHLDSLPDPACDDQDSNICGLLNKEITELRTTVDSLMNFATGYARCIYDQCIAQETLLRREGYELLESSNNTFTNNRSRDSTNGPAAIILDHLDAQDETGNGIEWNAVLDKGNERREILARLSNRMQMGLYSLNKATEKQHKERIKTDHKIRREHDDQLVKLVDAHSKEQVLLQEELNQMSKKCEQCKASLRHSEEKCKDTASKLEIARQTTAEVKERFAEALGRISGLEEELCHSENDNNELKDNNKELTNVNSRQADTIARQYADLERKDDDIRNRDAISAQLERVLEKTTANYAATIEKERQRLATNRSVFIQSQPLVAVASHQTDLYIPPRLRSRPLSKDTNGEYIYSQVKTERIPLEYHSEQIP
mmetsp:Transcript_6461/g.13579  ORF Transcript_6461/g.13579 Transcript_6461/m.13579 type:complete len:776 (+) Transcript_6461:582-2909(+)|eukprot:CAMPEP_0178612222 /NCGR_PEP_ID=MMETSP0698-20121128/1016_1 /TAXON_ID=265572 /ORGANISM="Extubocellulus spinifer, Strain CCMP396" /LENGTH=775 /DNA_ID=CAMNT_0020250877 /DNA_START=476 /DNA_END=2803 /DNA_ORIENTATION=+